MMKRIAVLAAVGWCLVAGNGRAQSVDGVWLGTLQVQTISLRLQFHLSIQANTVPCTLDSIDQKAFGIPCTLTFQHRKVTAEVAAVQGAYKAELAADQNTMTGTWTQGVGSFPLILTRQATALVPPQATVDAAMPAVGIEQIQEIMDKDIAGALKEGALAPGTGAGVAVGVVQHGTRKLFRYGAVQVDSVFEIGSITKTMTATMLAQMVEQGKVRLDEPVRVLLPAGTVSKPSGAEIRLVDLSDQHSGLPRLPGNFAPADETNPYAGYDATKLYAFLAGWNCRRTRRLGTATWG